MGFLRPLSLRQLGLICAGACALSGDVLAHPVDSGAELSEFILWASDLGWGGVDHADLAKRQLWIQNHRILAARRTALAVVNSEIERAQKSLERSKNAIGYMGGQSRERSLLKFEIAAASQEIEAAEQRRFELSKEIAQLQVVSPVLFEMPVAWTEVELEAMELAMRTLGMTGPDQVRPDQARITQVDALGRQVASRLRGLSLLSPLPLEQWLKQRPAGARQVLLLTIAALKLSQVNAVESWRERLLPQFLVRRFLRRAGFRSLQEFRKQFEMRFSDLNLESCTRLLSP